MISGIAPLWASEIEPFPIRVTTKRLPDIQHLGDVSALNGADLPPVDIITFGSPCQDMSVAGKRTGLNGSRSCLFYEAVRIVKEMRCKTDGKYPRFVVWENVPGAFSSNKGEDFKAVLEALCGIKDEAIAVPEPDGKWENAGCIMGEDFSIAWRVFDAQYWGVPQRRKRIYLVADFADRCAGKILFESEGVSGYSPQGFKSWQGAAGSTEESTGASSLYLNDQGGERMDVTEDITATLRAASNHPPLVFENHSQDTRYKGPLDIAPTVLSTYGTGGNNQPLVLKASGFCTEHSANARSIGYEEERSPTLRAGVVPATIVLENHPADSRVKISEDGKVQTLKTRSGCEGSKGAIWQEENSATFDCNNDQTVFVPKAYGICSKASHSMQSDNPNSGFYEADTSRCLDANGGNPNCNQGGIAVVESYAIQGSMIGREDKNGPQGDGINEDVSFTLNTVDRHAVYAMTAGSFTQVEKDTSPTIMARDYKDPNVVCMGRGYTVRRLTPTECARLQGFPDWWCDDLGTDDPTEEEIAWWTQVFQTHAKAMGKSTKPKTRNQIVKWLKNPYSDAAAYKMWGNGVALPNVCFVLAGIVYYA